MCAMFVSREISRHFDRYVFRRGGCATFKSAAASGRQQRSPAHVHDHSEILFPLVYVLTTGRGAKKLPKGINSCSLLFLCSFVCFLMGGEELEWKQKEIFKKYIAI